MFAWQVEPEAKLVDVHNHRTLSATNSYSRCFLIFGERNDVGCTKRANSDSGQYNTSEPESPSSPVNSSAANGQTSEGFHFYATVKKQHSLPEVGGKNSTPKTRLNEQRAEKLNGSKTIEVTKEATSEKASH